MNLEEDYLRSCFPFQKVGYGLGHVFNDLCAAMWFSYTLFYLQVVLTMKSNTAGILLMTGQVVDALATPLAGWAIDFTGHQKIWHLIGTAAVALGFPLIFSLKTDTFDSLAICYYVLVIILFQIGWAIVQISHLSIIPQISRNQRHSSDLTAIRYTASVCCSVTVYVITLIILRRDGETGDIGPNDFFKFKEIAVIITFIGLLSSMLFYCGLLASIDFEYEEVRETEIGGNHSNIHNNGKHFLKELVTYCVALMYMSSRLFTILNLIYIPLYIDERADFDVTQIERIRQTVAMVPLVTYISSFVTSIFLKLRFKTCNDMTTYLIGTMTGFTASIWIRIGVSPTSDWALYCIAVLLGVCGSLTMVASLCLTANFVKTNGYGGGSVYSVVTFTDKLISGGVVMLVQTMQCSSKADCPHYYEHVLTYVCGLVSLVGLSSLILLKSQRATA